MGGCWARRQLSNGIRYASIASRLRKSLSSVERTFMIALAILYSTADYSTTIARILMLFAEGCWAWRQLSNGIRYVSVASRLRKSLSSVERIFIVALAIFYTTADYSTASGRISMLFAGGCWARFQLPNGIGYISVASGPRKSLSSVERIFIVTLAIFYSTADYSTTT